MFKPNEIFRECVPSTRMLLFGDGSTTRLLECLIQTPLSVEVVKQQPIEKSTLDDDISPIFRTIEKGDLVERISCLKTEDGHVVSRNYVIAYLHTDKPFQLLSDKGLGKQLQETRYFHTREWIGCGVRLEQFEKIPRSSMYKHYSILFEDQSIFYVKESFHPDIIKVPESLSIANE